MDTELSEMSDTMAVYRSAGGRQGHNTCVNSFRFLN